MKLANDFTFKTTAMLRVMRESEQNVELIKQRIDLFKENLKFINSFYLPLLSGIAILVVTDTSQPIIFRYAWALMGLVVLSFLNLLKQDIAREINGLIDQL